MPEKIYLVEDDNNIRKLVDYALKSNGFLSESFAKPSDFWKALSNELPSLVLLDIMLPEEDGLEILKKLRNKTSTKDIPVIMLTAKTSEYDKVIGLDNGADDYIPKPFGMMELISRIKAVLRRYVKQDDKVYRLGELYVNEKKHIVKVGEETVTLALKEYELLCMLLRNEGAVLTRDVILNEIWGYAFDGESRTVDVHIRKLRSKLGKAGDCIETVKGIGYKIGGEEF